MAFLRKSATVAELDIHLQADATDAAKLIRLSCRCALLRSPM